MQNLYMYMHMYVYMHAYVYNIVFILFQVKKIARKQKQKESQSGSKKSSQKEDKDDSDSGTCNNNTYVHVSRCLWRHDIIQHLLLMYMSRTLSELVALTCEPLDSSISVNYALLPHPRVGFGGLGGLESARVHRLAVADINGLMLS